MEKLVSMFNNALGVIFLLIGFFFILGSIIGETSSGGVLFAGVLFLVISGLLLSPIRDKFFLATNKTISGLQRFGAVFLLFTFAMGVIANSDFAKPSGTASPADTKQTPAVNNAAEDAATFAKAESLYKDKNLSLALMIYGKLNSSAAQYKTAQEKMGIIRKELYDVAVSQYDSGDIAQAEIGFNAVGPIYNNAQDYLTKIQAQKQAQKYEQALSLLKKKDYAEASAIFAELGGYKDSATRKTAADNALLAQTYQNAAKLLNTGKYEEAKAIYEQLGDYKNSVKQVDKIEGILLDKKSIRLSYGKLKKNPDSYAGTLVKYYGKIFTIREEGAKTIMQINITNQGYGFWDDQIMVVFDGLTELEEGNTVTFYGTIVGGFTYQSAAGWNITVPLVDAAKLVF
jgi:tetratricopeptide (TPR) repeat protein